MLFTTIVVVGGLIFGTAQAEWELDVYLAGGLTSALVETYRTGVAPPPSPPVQVARSAPAPRPPRLAPPGSVEQWRSLVEVYFQPEDVETALVIMWCESRGDHLAKNPRSSASGLFQHVRGWWSGAWGYPAFDPFDPESSIRAGAFLRYNHGGWGDWNPSRHCWGP